MRYFFLLVFFIFSCNSSKQNNITEQEVKDKFYEFFDILSETFDIVSLLFVLVPFA